MKEYKMRLKRKEMEFEWSEMRLKLDGDVEMNL